MAELSDRQIECLVSLVEMRLVELSRAGNEQSADTSELQHCRAALLAMAGSKRRAATLTRLAFQARARANHLRTIDGGKA